MYLVSNRILSHKFNYKWKTFNFFFGLVWFGLVWFLLRIYYKKKIVYNSDVVPICGIHLNWFYIIFI